MARDLLGAGRPADRVAAELSVRRGQAWLRGDGTRLKEALDAATAALTVFRDDMAPEQFAATRAMPARAREGRSRVSVSPAWAGQAREGVACMISRKPAW